MKPTHALSLALIALATTQPALAAPQWRTILSCENNSVRLDLDGQYVRPNFQLVIEHQRGGQYLVNAGAINTEQLRDGKIILSGRTNPASWNYFVMSPRDNGILVHQIMFSDVNKTLDVAASWRGPGTPNNQHVPNFTGYKFYGCRTVY